MAYVVSIREESTMINRSQSLNSKQSSHITRTPETTHITKVENSQARGPNSKTPKRPILNIYPEASIKPHTMKQQSKTINLGRKLTRLSWDNWKNVTSSGQCRSASTPSWERWKKARTQGGWHQRPINTNFHNQKTKRTSNKLWTLNLQGQWVPGSNTQRLRALADKGKAEEKWKNA